MTIQEIDRILKIMSNEHMVPQWCYARAWVVECKDGSSCVLHDDLLPLAKIGRTYTDDSMLPEDLHKLADYCESYPVSAVTRMGWLAQLSALGYMDQTDLTIHDSEEDAKRYLVDTYGDDLDEEAWEGSDDIEEEI